MTEALMTGIIVLILLYFILLVLFINDKRKFRPHGEIVIMTDPSGKKIITLEIDMDPGEIENMDLVIFKVMPDEEE